MNKHFFALCAFILGACLTTRAWSDIPSAPEAGSKGVFGPVINWPIIPIHLTLLPNGHVLSFGSTTSGAQGGLVNAIWDPNLGTGSNAHIVTP